MEKKKLIEVVASVIIALLFLSAFAAYASINSNAGSGSASTITTTVPYTVYAYSTANATILNFTQNLQITVLCTNSSNTVNYLSGVMLDLENNGSVSNYLPIENQISVQTGKMTAGSFYSYTRSQLNASSINCTSFSGEANADLPPAILFTVSGQKQPYSVQLTNAQRGFQIPLYLNYSSNTIPVRVIGLLESNGTVYQLNITRGA